jgi:hypothetical protein
MLKAIGLERAKRRNKETREEVQDFPLRKQEQLKFGQEMGCLWRRLRRKACGLTIISQKTREQNVSRHCRNGKEVRSKHQIGNVETAGPDKGHFRRWRVKSVARLW